MRPSLRTTSLPARRALVAGALAVVLAGHPAGAETSEKRSSGREAPHYESPILSLLLLPVNLLIRAASILEPKGESEKARQEPGHAR